MASESRPRLPIGISDFRKLREPGILYVDKTVDDVKVEVAFQYTTGEEERVRCYANNAYNPGGGTHLSGFRTAITRALTAYGNKESMFVNTAATIGPLGAKMIPTSLPSSGGQSPVLCAMLARNRIRCGKRDS